MQRQGVIERLGDKLPGRHSALLSISLSPMAHQPGMKTTMPWVYTELPHPRNHRTVLPASLITLIFLDRESIWEGKLVAKDCSNHFLEKLQDDWAALPLESWAACWSSLALDG